MRIEPCNGQIITRKKETDKITQAGILLPSIGKDASGKSVHKNVVVEIMAIGPGARGPDGQRVPIDAVQVGDRVLVDRRLMQSLFVDGDEYYAITEDAVIGKVFDFDGRIVVPEIGRVIQ